MRIKHRYLNCIVNFQWELIKNVITSCIDTTAKLKQMPPKKSNNPPWIDKKYIILSKKRDIEYKKAIRSKHAKEKIDPIG